MGSLHLDTPIQFDMFSPAEGERTNRDAQREGPPVRINPFDQSSSTISSESAKDPASPFWEVFAVRFLGSMQVKTDRGDDLVYETIRHIMAARAIHNVFRMVDSHLVITHKTLRVVDPSHQVVRATFPLEDISFWTTHKENNRLLGFITRMQTDLGSPPAFYCHVFEAPTSAEEICSGLATAANIALKALLVQKTAEEIEENNSQEEQYRQKTSETSSGDHVTTSSQSLPRKDSGEIHNLEAKDNMQ